MEGPEPKTDHEWILNAIYRIDQLEQKDREKRERDRWVIGTVIALAAVVIVLLVAFIQA